MDRRDSLKTLLMGSLGAGMLITDVEAETNAASEAAKQFKLLANAEGNWDYGRTQKEKERDEELFSRQFFTDHELTTIAVLCDLILPATNTAGSATDAEVPAFIEFIAKDMSYLKTPLRGGLMWLDNHSKKLHKKTFADLNEVQQKAILDTIAYPETEEDVLKPGISFFREMRNLTLTGYYTTEMGYNDLGYEGNTPNVWDGVPEDVLKDHGLSYEEEWLTKCIDQDTRTEIAKWDEEGNLLN